VEYFELLGKKDTGLHQSCENDKGGIQTELEKSTGGGFELLFLSFGFVL
jgi:hypothetical protein